MRALINDSADLTVLSLLVGGCLVFFLPGIQDRWRYFAAAVALGLVGGLFGRELALFDGMELLTMLAGIVTGPITAAKMSGKTIGEAIEEIRQMRLDL
ncbi:MAG: hypothetical protein VX394_07860 [Pseudomonadota bacterium]|nr:hypothetical protein [Pseudomonadota bacterium]